MPSATKLLPLLLLLLVSSHSLAKPKVDTLQQHGVFPAQGIFALDYEVIPVPGDASIDLLGFHYLHQLSDWFYLGAGLHAPLFQGDYGGFMAFDVTTHLQKDLSNKLSANIGLSLGGGGGGSTVQQSKLLSGRGGFIKSYVGLTYRLPSFSLGLGLSNFRFFNSLIDSTQLNLVFHKPISFLAGSYLKPPKRSLNLDELYCESACKSASKMKISMDFNHLTQINPQGLYKKTIDLLSVQASYFMGENTYLFVAGDAGINGLPLYNQILGGAGYQFDISERFNMTAQLGAGSGGFAPSEIDTGPGLLLYPEIGLEYAYSKKLGFSVNAGYLFAVEGSSKNTTVGLGMNYYLTGADTDKQRSARNGLANKIRVHLYHQSKFDVRVDGAPLANLHMVTAQLDYVLNERWYVPAQLAFAHNEYKGFPGYGEVLLGLGVQTKTSANTRLQGFFQTLVGSEIGGVIVKPEIGVNYGFSDQIALYTQVGTTRSIDQFNDKTHSSYNLGLGITYRFSVLQ